MSLGQNNGGISRGGAPGSGGIGGPGKSSSLRKTPNSNSSSKPESTQNLAAQDEELALSGRYGFQPSAQKETIDSSYYNRVQIPISQGKAADARAEMPGIYQQIAQINSKNSYDLPGNDTKSNPFEGYDDDNSFGVSLF